MRGVQSELLPNLSMLFNLRSLANRLPTHHPLLQRLRGIDFALAIPGWLKHTLEICSHALQLNFGCGFL